MALALIIVAALALGGAYVWFRACSRMRRGSARLDQAWAEVEEALAARRAALEGFVSTLKGLGLVPKARRELEEVLGLLVKAQHEGPRALAEADERLRLALRAAYAGLPRTRPSSLREAQNRLAEAEDELDLARRRYNELVVEWNMLFSRWSYRLAARHLGLDRREPYLLPSEEEEFVRRHGPPI